MSYKSWKTKRAEKLIEAYINEIGSVRKQILTKAGHEYIEGLIKAGLKPQQILTLYKQNNK